MQREQERQKASGRKALDAAKKCYLIIGREAKQAAVCSGVGSRDTCAEIRPAQV